MSMLEQAIPDVWAGDRGAGARGVVIDAIPLLVHGLLIIKIAAISKVAFEILSSRLYCIVVLRRIAQQ